MITIDFTTKSEITHEYIVDEDDSKCLYDENGKLHSYNDLPALIYTNGRKYWYKHGLRHRNNGKPAIVSPDGRKQYWVDGKRIK